ncbi:helix-turn-helix domain-containing protein [Streptomyces sp. 1222.5]|uniref:helix-turn-helix domain-containing protein n=1 Tax=Streptomyces sp. 1222.5 TaxID=1881026 RepID=UPI003D738505
MTEETRRPRPAVQYGPTGHAVAENVKRLREYRGMTIYALSGALGRAGRPITPSAIAKIEKQQRQVSVDDLTALASTLRVSPLTLLLPRALTGDEQVEVTGAEAVSARALWQWADGARPLETSQEDPLGDTFRFRVDSRPAFARGPLDDQYNEALAGAVGTIAVHTGKGRPTVRDDGSIIWLDDDGRIVREWKPGVEPKDTD